jgi:hypothetical protein
MHGRPLLPTRLPGAPLDLEARSIPTWRSRFATQTHFLRRLTGQASGPRDRVAPRRHRADCGDGRAGWILSCGDGVYARARAQGISDQTAAAAEAAVLGCAWRSSWPVFDPGCSFLYRRDGVQGHASVSLRGLACVAALVAAWSSATSQGIPAKGCTKSTVG